MPSTLQHRRGPSVVRVARRVAPFCFAAAAALTAACGPTTSGVDRPIMDETAVPGWPVGDPRSIGIEGQPKGVGAAKPTLNILPVLDPPTFMLRPCANPADGFLWGWVRDDSILPVAASRLPWDGRLSADLIKQNQPAAVARFDPAAGRFFAASIADWRATNDQPASVHLPPQRYPDAPGDPWGLKKSMPDPPPPSAEVQRAWARWTSASAKYAKSPPWEWPAFKVPFDGAMLRIPEPWLVQSQLSPCARFMALLMRDGKLTDWSYPVPDGRTFVAVFDAATGTQVGETVQVGRGVRERLTASWTPDSRFVVVWEISGGGVSNDGIANNRVYVVSNPPTAKPAR